MTVIALGLVLQGCRATPNTCVVAMDMPNDSAEFRRAEGAVAASSLICAGGPSEATFDVAMTVACGRIWEEQASAWGEEANYEAFQAVCESGPVVQWFDRVPDPCDPQSEVRARWVGMLWDRLQLEEVGRSAAVRAARIPLGVDSSMDVAGFGLQAGVVSIASPESTRITFVDGAGARSITIPVPVGTVGGRAGEVVHLPHPADGLPPMVFDDQGGLLESLDTTWRYPSSVATLTRQVVFSGHTSYSDAPPVVVDRQTGATTEVDLGLGAGELAESLFALSAEPLIHYAFYVVEPAEQVRTVLGWRYGTVSADGEYTQILGNGDLEATVRPLGVLGPYLLVEQSHRTSAGRMALVPTLDSSLPPVVVEGTCGERDQSRPTPIGDTMFGRLLGDADGRSMDVYRIDPVAR
ncbi:MAG: hypothetical protein H6736_23475 [Alphaproteobacteria bacterium]|nr:hypothetical protein [Alphaproteobacteria bacterium]MCB9694784.1 hypothetical protein [Alphaproteobacteria bacterium]